MKVFLLEQRINNGYDTYDSVVVIAENEEEARKIYPSEFVTHISNDKWMGTYSGGNRIGCEYEIYPDDWVDFSDIHKIIVTEIGEANKTQNKGVVLASFNAG